MFDVGFSELLIIAVVALLVLGPERLPKAARFAGLWVRRARAQWYSVKAELERELAAEDLKRQFGDPLAQMRPAVEQLGQDLKQEFEGLDPKLPARVDLETPADAALPDATPVEADAPAPPVIGGGPWSIPDMAEGADDAQAAVAPKASTPEAARAAMPASAADTAAPDANADAPSEPRTGDLFGDGARRP